MLKANGIAPSSVGQKRPAEAQPEAEVKEEVIDIEDDNSEEIRALEVSGCFTFTRICFIRIYIPSFIQHRLNALRSKRSTSQGNPSKKVKREPRNQSSFVQGEVIDLT